MNNYFCVVPFYGKEIGPQTNQVCCLMKKRADLDTVRTQMLAGRRPDACKKCWDLEDQNITSDRQLKNQSYDFYADRDIRYVEQDCRSGNYGTEILKIYTSNLCNSTCVTCAPFASSAWSSLLKIHDKKSVISDESINEIDWSKIKILTFVGGEPLYEKKNFAILKKLIDVGNQDCFVSFTTNGSVTLTSNQIDILTKFKNVNYCISIDGTNKVFEYLRYPLSWDVLLTNLDFFRSISDSVSVSYTISNLNLIYHTETVAWFQSQKLNFNHNLVSRPEYFSPNSLPDNIKKSIPGVSHLLRPHQDLDDRNFEIMIQEIQKQDQLKNISIRNYLPEFSKLIDRH